METESSAIEQLQSVLADITLAPALQEPPLDDAWASKEMLREMVRFWKNASRADGVFLKRAFHLYVTLGKPVTPRAATRISQVYDRWATQGWER
nr:hypothetical protein BdHM001_34930 [Bdellovibrio sp. HM001]